VKVLVSGVCHRAYSLSESMQIEAEKEIERTRQGLSILDTIITLAPLLGILGTVTGIIQAFDLLGASGIPDPRVATAGISQALITTAAGLVIAIATLIPFNYFVRRVQRRMRHLEHTATRFEVVYRKSLERKAAQDATEQRV
jgi:biopolymer transport protein ExbB